MSMIGLVVFWETALYIGVRCVDFVGGEFNCDTIRLHLNLGNKLVKCYSWKVNQKYFDSCEMWSWMDGEDQLDRTCEKWRIIT